MLLLSATYDSFVGFSFNRYAYCMYNPLKYVDPTGERYFGWSGGSLYQIEQEARRVVRQIWRDVYDNAILSHQLTLIMANAIYSNGPLGGGVHGSNGSGNHGSGGGGSVEVQSMGDGKYKVVKGLYDGGNTVYVVDEQGTRTGEVLGHTLTPYTFYNEKGLLVDNTIIDLNDHTGQLFYNDIKDNTPGEYYYAFGDEKANGQKYGNYDFKAIGLPMGLSEKEVLQYYDRGMPFDYGNGVYIASARDVGNFVAGFVAGKNGVGIIVTRLGFDWYQKGIEPKVSRRAQNKGYFWGLRCFFGF